MHSIPRWQNRSKQERHEGPVSVEEQVTGPESAPELTDLEEGVQEVHDELRKATITQITLTLLAAFAICYFAKLVLVTIFTSILIAFVLEPLVRGFARLRIPRTLGSALAVLLVLGLTYGLSYFFYQRAVDFAHQLPKMSGEIKKVVARYEQNAAAIRKSAQSVIPPKPEDGSAVPVKVQQDPGIASLIGGGDIANFGELLISVAFIPFIVYFMLTCQDHARRSTVRLFPAASRLTVYQTLGKISEMMRAFIVGNFVIGVFMAVASAIVFAFLHLPYFYFLGLISGFLSLVPYLGLILALMPPVASGVGVLRGSGLLLVLATIAGLHVFSMNVLYPKVLGRRLELNPLAVTLGLLIWSWIWGAMGLILAVPVVGAIKIVCDNVNGLEPFGRLLGVETEDKKQQVRA